MKYETIICFETHVELKTCSKLFCSCPVGGDAAPNTRICPVCTGQPGALPKLNRKAVEYAVRAGLALNCRINPRSRFARKNYTYPDLPKGYQISQYDQPVCENGCLEITGDDGRPYPVGIKRIHLEEDAGKLIHSGSSIEGSAYSLVDFNRAGIPLLEIVMDHRRNPLRSPGEARRYLEKMRQLLRYIGVSDCLIERGQFRCDVNISLRASGSNEFGGRAEIKNMGSFTFIQEAILCEIQRQARLLLEGKPVPQETRMFDEKTKTTLPMRTKEDAPDYRYFPDPDLVELEIGAGLLEEIRKTLPEFAGEKEIRLQDQYGLSQADARLLAHDRATSDFFEACSAHCSDWKRLCQWIKGDLFALLRQAGMTMEQCPIKPEDFSRLVAVVVRGEINEGTARSILAEMFRTGAAPDEVIEKNALNVIRDEGYLKRVVDEVLGQNQELAAEVMSGKSQAGNFLMGEAMRRTGGKADPRLLRRLLEEKLNPRS